MNPSQRGASSNLGGTPLTRSSQEQQNPLLRGAFYLLLIILFATFSALFEVTPVVHAVRPVLILSILGLLVVLATGRFVKVLLTPIGMSIAAFTAWFIACIPFGAWPGGSFHVFTDLWYKASLIFLMTAALLTTLPQANLLFRAIAYAVGLLGILGVGLNQEKNGRLAILNTRYENANEYAWTLLVGLTFIGYLYVRGTRVQKYFAMVMGLIVLLAIAKTGSRGGMLGVLVVGLMAFIRASRTTRIKLVLGVTFIFVLISILLPGKLLNRFTTWRGQIDPYDLHSIKSTTVASTEARLTLLKDSLRVTAMHPFLGVGPGNFPVVQNELAQERGNLGNWQVTHNSFTEVSCEMGLPGLVIYLTFLYQLFKQLNSIIRTRTRSPAWSELRIMAMTLQAAMIAFLVTAISTSLEFNADVPILAGITVALGFIAQRQRALDRAAAATVTEELVPPDTSREPVALGQY